MNRIQASRLYGAVAQPALLAWGCFLFTSQSMLGQSPIFPSVTNIPVGSFPSSVAMADFNGDRHLDLAVVNNGANTVTVLLGNGLGGFSAAVGSPFAVGSGPTSAAVGDFNRDGKLDLAITNSNDQTVTVLLGNGLGGFVAARGSPFPAGDGPFSVVVGDFNRDGKPDLAVVDTADGTVTILLGDGLGGFTAAGGSPFPVGVSPVSLATGDYNGDGNPDLAVANAGDNTVTVLLGDGLGHFSAAPASPILVGSTPFSILVSDFNADSKPDLAIVNTASNTVTVLLGNGSGGFVPSGGSPFPVGSAPFSIAAGDFNLDNKADLAIANLGDGTVSVLLGDGKGEFILDPGPGPIGAALESIAVGDLNGDGKPDLAVANAGNAAVSIMLNAVTLAQASITISGGSPQSSLVMTPFPVPLQVTVTDSSGNPMSGVVVTFGAPTTGASGTFAGGVNTATTNALGVATAAVFTANAIAGSFTVTASTSETGTPAAFALTNLANQPKLSPAITPTDGTPQSTIVTTPFAKRLQATVTDSDGHSESGVLVLFAAPTSGASGSFAGSATVATNSSGVAIAPPLIANTIPGAYVVTATAAGIATPANFLLTNLIQIDEVRPSVVPDHLVLEGYLGAGAGQASGKLSVTTANDSTFSVASAVPWLAVSPGAGVTPATVTVTANPAGLTPGTVIANLTFTFTDNRVVSIPVSLRVMEVPRLIPTRTAVSFAVEAGDTVSQTADLNLVATSRNVAIQVTPSMASPAGGGWLRVSPASGTTPMVLHIVANPAGLASGTYQGAIAVSSGDAQNSPLSIPVTLTVNAPPPAIALASLNSAASMIPGSAAPNLIMSAMGTFPSCSSGAQVLIDGRAMDVFFSSPAQINFLVSAQVAGKSTVPVQISCAGLSSQPMALPVVSLAPAIFTASGTGIGQAAILNQDGSTGKPSPPGSIISAYLTGLGAFASPGSTGWREMALPVTARIGSLPAEVLYAGEAPGFTSGLQQINVRIPGDAPRGNAISLQFTIGGMNTQPGVTLAIQ